MDNGVVSTMCVKLRSFQWTKMSASQYHSGRKWPCNALNYLEVIGDTASAMSSIRFAGAGLSLAMACDIRICSEKTKLTTAFGNVRFLSSLYH